MFQESLTYIQINEKDIKGIKLIFIKKNIIF